ADRAWRAHRSPIASGCAGRHRRQHHCRGRCDDGWAGWRQRTHPHRERRGGERQERRHAQRQGGDGRVRLPRAAQPRMAQDASAYPASAGAEETGRRVGTTRRRSAGEAGRMPENTTRPLMRHAARAACLMLLCAAAAAAQPPNQPVIAPVPDTPQFLTRYDFHMAASALANNDVRFSWDTHFGGALDMVDYIVGRAGVSVDYEAVLGDEFRLFDPNQGNYTLEAFASGRWGSTELVGIFHHVSRHLSDRPKRFAIAWNLAGARLLHQVRAGDTVFDIDLEGGSIVQHSYVDYSWIGELHVQARKPIHPVVEVYGRLFGQLIGVNGDVQGRDTQRGGSAEAGFRLIGKGAVMELFAGVERRIDADPFDRQPHQWALAGFR